MMTFFELGLDSLLAIRLSLDIYYEFKINLTVSDLFKNNTISKLALLIEKTEKEDLNNNEIFNITKPRKNLIIHYHLLKKEFIMHQK